MKLKSSIAALSVLAVAVAHGDGLYYVGSEAQESLPLKWVVGLNLTWDDNVTPGGVNDGDESFSLNPYVGASFVTITPQTTIDLYARLGAIYYLDKPDAIGSDDFYTQARAGLNITHRFSERLRLSSRNFLAYELEPDYSYGFATTRQIGEYLYWQTDNALGYRWTERFATYTGFTLTGLDYDNVNSSDRFTWTLYNQFRYQLTPQTVLTADYRYSETDGSGLSSDSSSHYFLLGVEHRFSPNTILTARAGIRNRDVDAAGANSETNFHFESALRSQINDQFGVRVFARYGVEDYDTVQFSPGGLVEFDERKTLRIGVSGEYSLSPTLSLFGGVDLISTSFEGARAVAGAPNLSDRDETLVNLYVGASMKFTDYLFGTVSYNYTNSDSDFVSRDYDRNRVSVGLRAEF